MNLKRIVVIPLLFLAVSACNEEDKMSMMMKNMPQFQLWEEDFNGADLNGDGILDAGEIQAKIARSFANEDRDSDGVLTALDHIGPEYQSGEVIDFLDAPPIEDDARGEIEFDSNADGTVTFEEYASFHNQNFVDPIDSDDDGQFELLDVFRFYDPGWF